MPKKSLTCANCAKSMGEINQVKLGKDLRCVCQNCLDGLYRDRKRLIEIELRGLKAATNFFGDLIKED